MCTWYHYTAVVYVQYCCYLYRWYTVSWIMEHQLFVQPNQSPHHLVSN